MPDEILGRLKVVPVVPVVVIEDAGAAVPLARALAEGGLNVVEITLRTSVALDAIRRVASEVPGVLVGAGTVTSQADIDAAIEAGARFLVSPGTPTSLASAARAAPVPFLPGCATVTEAMALRDLGFPVLKFFPAEQAGGAAALKAIAGPLPDARFVPTGGIGAGNAGDYLALPNVVCVGGSWVAPADAVRAGDWGRITALARETANLSPR